ncbi:hypothetical protein FOZ62_027797 [Perkinsus olseni]|uniref:Uncharacterized protein n=1 Tax=Perkinsus olseni TaxID=32597 RepID=A0A7J6STV0_PEROL|nr:hypothetical protein FOZ62_027797 [Perkinsus olseni]
MVELSGPRTCAPGAGLYGNAEVSLRWELISLAGTETPPLGTVWDLLDEKFGYSDTPGSVAARWESLKQAEGETVLDLYSRLLRERVLYWRVTESQLPPAVVAAKFVAALAPPLREALEQAWGRVLGDLTAEQVRDHAVFYEERQTAAQSIADKAARNRRSGNANSYARPGGTPNPTSGPTNGQGKTQQQQQGGTPSAQRNSIGSSVAAGVRCKFCSEKGYRKADKHTDATCWENPANASKRPPWFKPLEGRSQKPPETPNTAIVEAGKTFMTCTLGTGGLVGMEAIVQDETQTKELPALLLLDTGSEYTLASTGLIASLGVELTPYERPMVLAGAGKEGSIAVTGEVTLPVIVKGTDGRSHRFRLTVHVAANLNQDVARSSAVLLGLTSLEKMRARIAIGESTVFLEAIGATEEISAGWLADNAHLIGFFTHRWNSAERNYDIACKELHIICHAVDEWKQLLLTYTMHNPRPKGDPASAGRIIILSDSSSALGKLAARADITRYEPGSRQVKRWLSWLSLVSEFDPVELQFKHIPGRLNGFSDLLSRLLDQGRRYLPEGGGNPVVLATIDPSTQSDGSPRDNSDDTLARVLCDDGIQSELRELQKADDETKVHGASLKEYHQHFEGSKALPRSAVEAVQLGLIGVNTAEGPFIYLGSLAGFTTRMVPLGAREDFTISVSPAHLEPRGQAVDWSRPAVATEVIIARSAFNAGDLLLVRLADGGDVIGRVLPDNDDHSNGEFVVHVFDSPDGSSFWPVWVSQSGETYAAKDPVSGDEPLQRLATGGLRRIELTSTGRLRDSTRQELLQAGYLAD